MSQPAAPVQQPQPSAAERVGSFMRSVPAVTRLIVLLCVAWFIYTPVSGDHTNEYALNLYGIKTRGEWYRFFLSSITHAGYLHIAMNMLSFFYLGAVVEIALGSLPTAGLTLLFVVLGNSGYLLLTTMLPHMLGSWADKYIERSAVGFSGAIFGFLAVDTARVGPYTVRRLFGIIPVVAWIYPWALLVMLSFMMSNVSFFGHFCGMLTGYLYTKGVLQALSLPRAWIVALERQEWGARVFGASWYVKCPLEEPMRESHWACTTQCHAGLRRAIERCWRGLRSLVATRPSHGSGMAAAPSAGAAGASGRHSLLGGSDGAEENEEERDFELEPLVDLESGGEGGEGGAAALGPTAPTSKGVGAAPSASARLPPADRAKKHHQSRLLAHAAAQGGKS
jgi:membrane associated rhomboid family serine protease